MNLKWVSDRLDDLINEANVCHVLAYLFAFALRVGVSQNDSDRFKDIPIDRRHLEAKAAKAKKGKLKRDIAGGIGRYDSPPSIKDFPKSWLPRPSDRPQTSPSAVSPHH
jgi:small subunit ribosomal protein S35